MSQNESTCLVGAEKHVDSAPESTRPTKTPLARAKRTKKQPAALSHKESSLLETRYQGVIAMPAQQVERAERAKAQEASQAAAKAKRRELKKKGKQTKDAPVPLHRRRRLAPPSALAQTTFHPTPCSSPPEPPGTDGASPNDHDQVLLTGGLSNKKDHTSEA